MKRTLFFLLCCLCGSLPASAQNGVPEPALKRFAQLYPEAPKTEWEKEGEYYEAEFKQNGRETSVLFDAAGQVLAVETELPVSGLPAAAKSALDSRYPGARITEVSLIDQNGVKSYEVEMKHNGKKREVRVDDKGREIPSLDGEEGENEEDDDDDQ